MHNLIDQIPHILRYTTETIKRLTLTWFWDVYGTSVFTRKNW